MTSKANHANHAFDKTAGQAITASATAKSNHGLEIESRHLHNRRSGNHATNHANHAATNHVLPPLFREGGRRDQNGKIHTFLGGSEPMESPVLNLNFHLNLDHNAVFLPVSTRFGPVPVWLDAEDAARLDGRPLSRGSHGYPQLNHGGQATLLHRWVMGAEVGDPRIVDHVSRDRYDCRKRNLRFVTPSASASNRRCSGRSGWRGVYPHRRKWQARVKVQGRRYYLGTYETPEEAALVSHEFRERHLPGYRPAPVLSLLVA